MRIPALFLLACLSLICFPALTPAEPMRSKGPGEVTIHKESVEERPTAYYGEHAYKSRHHKQEEAEPPPQALVQAECNEPPGAPEPATLTLGLLALGAMGVGVWRKRRVANLP